MHPHLSTKVLTFLLCISCTLLCTTSYRDTKRQLLYKRSINIPRIDLQIIGELPRIKFPHRFMRLNKRWISTSIKRLLINDENTILIAAKMLDEKKIPKSWNDDLSNPRSTMYQELSENYCEFLTNIFQMSNVSELKHPMCTFLQFKKSSIISEALFSFEASINAEFSDVDMIALLINGLQYLQDILMNSSQSMSFQFQIEMTNSLPGIEVTNSSQVTVEIPQNNATSPDTNNNTSLPHFTFQMFVNSESLSWDEGLLNPSSEIYQNISKAVCNTILKSLQNEGNLSQWRFTIKNISFLPNTSYVTVWITADDNSGDVNALKLYYLHAFISRLFIQQMDLPVSDSPDPVLILPLYLESDQNEPEYSSVSVSHDMDTTVQIMLDGTPNITMS
ncbi:unnamed protein product [Trichobilharzia szidati]|nr:unnamed protein product [Trichobilharzia szidati]